MPRLYKYLRHSDDAKDQPNSREAQLRAIQLWIDLQATQGSAMSLLVDGGEFYDCDVSGGIELFKRQAGAVLKSRLQPGDVIVAAKWDRVFRDLRDGINTLHWLGEQGISIVCIDLNVDTRTAAGYMVAVNMLNFANFERKRIGERTKEGLAVIKHNKGVAISYRCPWGWKRVRRGEQKRKDGQPYATIVPDVKERYLCQDVVRLHEEKKMSFQQIATFFTRNGRKSKKGKTTWSLDMTRFCYLAAKAGFPCGPNTDQITGENSELLMVPVEVT